MRTRVLSYLFVFVMLLKGVMVSATGYDSTNKALEKSFQSLLLPAAPPASSADVPQLRPSIGFGFGNFTIF